MKGKLRKVLTILLVLTLTFSMTVPASAGNRFGSSNSGWSVSSWLSDWWSSWWPFGHSDNTNHNDSKSDDKQNTDTETKGTSTSADAQKDTSSDTTQKTDTKSEDDTQLQLVEDQSTVAPGTKLRASTYKVMAKAAPAKAAAAGDGSTGSDQIDGYTVKYFPVTMFKYNTDVINSKTYALDKEKGTGIYFNNGSPKYQSGEGNKTQGGGASYNFWTGAEKNGANRVHKGYVYSGLVDDNLSNGQIKFNEQDPGIFTTDETEYNNKTYKDVYTNVGLPFVYDKSKREYTFDASVHGAYFKNGNAESNENLIFSKEPQKVPEKVGDVNEGKGFFPFNNATAVKASDAKMHFGMVASIPFTMTSNGRLDASNSNSEPIEFDFAGDDDVWVFVDGKLVLDIGGIHDSVSGRINFADNTCEIKATDSSTGSGILTTGFNYTSMVKSSAQAGAENWINVGSLFNEDKDGKITTGILNQDRETFAAKEDSHTLMVYYLERGEGASNCKISFNLPQRDYVSVTKAIDKDLYQKDNPTQKSSQKVSDALLETLKNRSFDFVLYLDDNTVAANQTFAIYNENNAFVRNSRTDENGKFSILYGQTARFSMADIGQYGTEGKQTRYHVEEINPGSAYGEPEWNSDDHACAGTFSSTAIEKKEGYYVSDAVQATGSDESADYIHFTCKNKLLTPVADIQDDKVVIDYGLLDQIHVLSNDTYTDLDKVKRKLKVTGISLDNSASTSFKNSVQGKFGKATLTDNDTIIYQLTTQMTGVDVFYYNVTLSDDTEANQSMGVGKLYVIPATSMYYEEDFGDSSSNLIQYTGNWTKQDTNNKNTFQEEGKVASEENSPYGSDRAYQDDNQDSNGTSEYVSTVNGAAKFEYTFTGTGTTFFARTTNNSAFMRVNVVRLKADGTEDTDNEGYTDKRLRDTRYKNDTSETLYNIPVYSYTANAEVPYGTYKVSVTLAKGTKANGLGTDFWLDGIRIINPLNQSDENVSVAKEAYRNDGEADMKCITLRDKLLTDAVDPTKGNWKDGNNFVLFTDTNGEMKTASEYQSIGPKEEVYLNNGQSVQFSMKNWDTKNNKVYLGMKAPKGSGTVNINNNSVQLNNSVDCYFDITDYAKINNNVVTFNIKAGENSLISVTNIKVTGNPEFVIVDNEENEDVEGNDSDSDETGDDSSLSNEQPEDEEIENNTDSQLDTEADGK